jgi:microcystin-dependent protein
MDPIIGQIILWPVPWVPQDWALCDGRLLSVNQYAALYSLLGTMYGGDGKTTFGLPNLSAKVAVGTQTMQSVGQTGGAPTSTTTAIGTGNVALTINNLPPHTHAATFTPAGSTVTASVAIPANANAGATSNIPGTTEVLGEGLYGTNSVKMYSTAAPTTTLQPFNVPVPTTTGAVAIGSTGVGQPLPIQVSVPVTSSTIQPFLTLNFIIALNGIYPPRP